MKAISENESEQFQKVLANDGQRKGFGFLVKSALAVVEKKKSE